MRMPVFYGEVLMLSLLFSAYSRYRLTRAALAAGSQCASENRCRLNGTLQGSVLLLCCQR